MSEKNKKESWGSYWIYGWMDVGSDHYNNRQKIQSYIGTIIILPVIVTFIALAIWLLLFIGSHISYFVNVIILGGNSTEFIMERNNLMGDFYSLKKFFLWPLMIVLTWVSVARFFNYIETLFKKSHKGRNKSKSIGYIFYILAVSDFISGNFLDFDITGLWWSPIALGLIGSIIISNKK